jgi:hypothetical protein
MKETTGGAGNMYLGKKGACICIWFEDFPRMFQLIFFQEREPHQIIRRFDHTACQVMYDGEQIHCTSHSFYSTFHLRETVIDRMCDDNRITAHRAVKMERKGYVVRRTSWERPDKKGLADEIEKQRKESFIVQQSPEVVVSALHSIQDNIKKLETLVGVGQVTLYVPTRDVAFTVHGHDEDPDCCSCLCEKCRNQKTLFVHGHEINY